MFFAHLKSRTQTLRFRLGLWNAAVVVLTAFATLWGLREGVRRALFNEVDQVLLEDLSELRLAVDARKYPDSNDLCGDLDRKARAHRLHGWYVRFTSMDGKVRWSSVGAPPAFRSMPNMRDFTPISVEEHRVVQYQYLNRPTPLVIRVGSSLKPVNLDLSRLDRTVLSVSGLVLVIAPLTGYWLAGRATRPFAQMIRTTDRLRPEHLEERLPIRGTNDELDQVACHLNRLLDRIGQHLEENRNFLANAAHELRTPLAAIRSSAEVALRSSRSREEYQELLESLLQESASLEIVVNQLLLLAETEASRLTTHGDLVNLNTVVSKSVDIFSAVAEDKGIQLGIQRCDSVTIEGNRHHLRQVMNNLLDNAIKFTPRGGSVTVCLTRDEANRRAVLHVRDTGVGISPNDLPHVFERFFRSDRSRPRQGETWGTGLGLSICQAVVQAHGGRLTIDSKPGSGTVLEANFPLATTSNYDEAPVARQIPISSHAGER